MTTNLFRNRPAYKNGQTLTEANSRSLGAVVDQQLGMMRIRMRFPCSVNLWVMVLDNGISVVDPDSIPRPDKCQRVRKEEN